MSGRLDNLSFHLLEGTDPGAPLTNGELELVDPWFLLAYFSPRFRRYYDQQAAGHLASGAADPVIEQAMGGLDDHGEPRDVVYPPEVVAQIAGKLDAAAPASAPQGDPSLILHWFEDMASDLEGTDSDLDAVAGKDALDAWVAAQVQTVRELYGAAATQGRAVAVRWHPNP